MIGGVGEGVGFRAGGVEDVLMEGVGNSSDRDDRGGECKVGL